MTVSELPNVQVTMELHSRLLGTARNPALPPWHWQSRLHGETLDVVLVLEIPDSSWAVLNRKWAQRRLDDWLYELAYDPFGRGLRTLNEATGIENFTWMRFAKWLADQLAPRFPGLLQVRLNSPQDRDLWTCCAPGQEPDAHRTPGAGADPGGPDDARQEEPAQ